MNPIIIVIFCFAMAWAGYELGREGGRADQAKTQMRMEDQFLTSLHDLNVPKEVEELFTNIFIREAKSEPIE